jgi:hypothetical protein
MAAVASQPAPVRRQDNRRQQPLVATARRFREFGCAATSMRDIASDEIIARLWIALRNIFKRDW